MGASRSGRAEGGGLLHPVIPVADLGLLILAPRLELNNSFEVEKRQTLGFGTCVIEKAFSESFHHGGVQWAPEF